MGAESPQGSPVFFQKALSSLTRSAEIELPKNRTIHYETEVVVLISKSGENISDSNASTFIGGYALGLDLTDRSLQADLKEKRMPWFLSKSFHQSAVVTDFESPETFDLDLPFWLDKNDERVQTGNISEMIFPILKLISYLSHHIPLVDGDIIFTGTPQGVDILSPGDKLELGIGEKTKGRFTTVNRP